MYKERKLMFKLPDNEKQEFNCTFCEMRFRDIDNRDNHEIDRHMDQIDVMYDDYKGLIPSG